MVSRPVVLPPASAGPSTARAPGTHFASCPVCGADAAEPAGVTGIMGDEQVSVLVMRCSGCASVYLSPPAPPAAAGVSPSPAVLTRGRIRHWTRGLGADASIFVAACREGPLLRSLAQHGRDTWILHGMPCAALIPERCRMQDCGVAADSFLQRAGRSGGYDLVLLPHLLETASRPDAVLRHAAALLTEAGRIVSIQANVDSACFRTFGGRHWSGYRYPHTRQYPAARALDRLCAPLGLRVIAAKSMYAGNDWLASLSNCLADWGASPRCRRALTGRWGIPQAAAALLEGSALVRGRGALLSVELAKA